MTRNAPPVAKDTTRNAASTATEGKSSTTCKKRAPLLSSLRGLLALWSGCLAALGASFSKLAFSALDEENTSTDPQRQQGSHHIEDYFKNACGWILPAAIGDWILIAPSSSPFLFSSSSSSSWTVCDVASLAFVRGGYLLAMIGCNALMLGSFVRGMEESGSVAGTALSTAANFACSAFLGFVLWNEMFPPIWWLGFSMVVLGTYLLSTVGIIDNNKINGNNSSNQEGIPRRPPKDRTSH